MAFHMIIASMVMVTISYAIEGDKFAKKAVTTVKTEHGDIYDCVDIYKQPSLNHLVLKDHKMSPGEGLKDALTRLQPKSNKIVDVNIGLEKGCPQGTVPIRQFSSKHIIRSRMGSGKHQSIKSSTWAHGLEFAGLQTIANPKNEFVGSGAVFSLYNPQVGPHQFSSAMISFQSGENQIQVGWTVNPDLYGDTRTRLFTSWTADNHQKTGCFNILCPGFLLVSPNYPLDFAFPNISVINKVTFDMGLYVNQDNEENWHLSTYPDHHEIGFWPHTLFNNFHFADTIKWGGQIFTPLTDDSSPQMGSGAFNNGRYDRTCYMKRILYANSTGIITDLDDATIERVPSRCYFAADNSYKDDKSGYSFLFGGGGGKDHSKTCDY